MNLGYESLVAYTRGLEREVLAVTSFLVSLARSE
jgi:hypothetical protein